MRYAENSADFVITDIIMPEVEGIETIRSLSKSNSGCKIIAMSGGGRIDADKYLRMAKQMGADDVIPKPIEETILLDSVSRVLTD